MLVGQKSPSPIGEAPIIHHRSASSPDTCHQQPTRRNPHNIFVGRQPIYNQRLDTIGYEVLFRNNTAHYADFLDGDRATVQVLLNTCIEIGLEAIVGNKPAFINFTRDLLLQDHAFIFPPERIVVEVVENTSIDADLLGALLRLSTHGYTIVLDDFVYQDYLRPLVDLADIIKIDVCALDRIAVKEHVELLRPLNVDLLAEKVETLEEFRYCKDLGFTYFQGYFFCRPDIVKSKRSFANRLTLLHLLSELQNPDVDFRKLQDLICRDVSLTYKLLRVINSAFYGLAQKVESVRQCLLLLGTRAITTWVTLILLTGIDDKPHELLTTSMIRAHMCERLAQAMTHDGRDTFFLVGLFSVLDALLDRPLPEALAELPLTDNILQALLYHTGTLGETLECVLAYERGDWEQVSCQNLDHEVIADAYLEALRWAAEASNTLGH
jgi:EAL and modified HD-GYP domain-containing signal transduction protein